MVIGTQFGPLISYPGGVENLIYGDLPRPEPGPGQALVRLAASGVNFIDIYFRTGLYKADPPVVLGYIPAVWWHRLSGFRRRRL